MNENSVDPYLPQTIEIIDRREESSNIFTLDLRFQNPDLQSSYRFIPGQFNMLYLYGVGEVPISISSDPKKTETLSHTIRSVGRVTKAMQGLKIGDQLGLRGPFGNGWPVKAAENKDVVIISGGLGCAPTVSMINYMMARRERFGHIFILQGVKHSDDLIFRKQYDLWRQLPDTSVYIAADHSGPQWPWKTGYVTDMIDDIELRPERSLSMMCGPEMMMQAAVKGLSRKGLKESDIYWSMERNMECGIGHCGHCQYGGQFICKDGPVFVYPDIKALVFEKGF